MIRTDMPDAYKLVMRIAHTGVLPFSEEELLETLKRRNDTLVSRKTSRVYYNTLVGLICDVVKSEGSGSLSYTNYALIEKLKEQAEQVETGDNLKALLKDVPSKREPLRKKLRKIEPLLQEAGIRIQIGGEIGDTWEIGIEYNPSGFVVRRNEGAPQEANVPAIENEAVPSETSGADVTNTPGEGKPNITDEVAQADEQVAESHSDPEQATQSDNELLDSP